MNTSRSVWFPCYISVRGGGNAFRSISYAFRSLNPKMTENLPINYVTVETESEVMKYTLSVIMQLAVGKEVFVMKFDRGS